MTVPATAQPFTERLPTDEERATAAQLRKIIAATASENEGAAVLRVQEPESEPLTLALTPGMSGLLLDLLRHIAKGETVALVPRGEMLTTQQAADILNVSRPHLIKIVEQGDIPHMMTGRHRRIRADDLFAYKRNRDARRSDALDDLASIDGDML